MSTFAQDVDRQLDLQSLQGAARESTGRDDFGNRDFILPLSRLLETAAREIRFTDSGLAGFVADVKRILVNRLRMQADLEANPQIFEEDVSDPIVVVGLVRTGTTKLQRLLALDPQVQSIPLWQILFPSRFADSAPGSPDPRPAFAAQSGGFAPGPAAIAMQAAHPMSLDIPDEDIILFENTFEHLYLYLRNAAPSYLEWLANRPARPAYELYRTMLQYLQWQNGGKRGRPWVLKCTTHCSELELFLDLFPRATVVHCHRDPCEVIPSYSRLQQLAWSLRGDPGEPQAIGRSVLNIWAAQMRKNLASRKKGVGAQCIVDVSYQSIKNESVATVGKIYEALGRPLTPMMRERIRAWERDNEQHKFGRHAYSAESFGLTAAAINAEFAEYRARFAGYL